MSGGREVRFIPSYVDGLPDVPEVAVHPDRLEVRSEGRWLIFRFTKIAEWPNPSWLWRRLARLGWRPRWLPVGERDWFHPPSERFFRFFTRPRIIVYLPDEPTNADSGPTTFRRVRDIMREGGFVTWDLR